LTNKLKLWYLFSQSDCKRKVREEGGERGVEIRDRKGRR